MSTTPRTNPPVTELEHQTTRLVRELKNLITVFLNCMFSLTPKGIRWRRGSLIGIFILIGVLFGFFRERALWVRHIRDIQDYLFDQNAAQSFMTNPILDFLQVVGKTYWNLSTLYYLMIFVTPFVAAWLLAAIYLADIFELKQVRTAWRFIFHVALWGGSVKIRVREGEMDTESEESPVYLIGGPGSVIVELDSAALFERPDGRPHVIGPTVDGPAVLDGFERFRQAIDLRDHRTETLNITSRSLDGIPVESVDVSFLFSVLRGNNQQPSIKHPYPFSNNNVIESLIYSQAAKVTPSGPRPADISKSWAGIMTGLIRSTLGKFMSQYHLTTYLASIGVPEVESARGQTDTVIQAARRILSPQEPPPSLSNEESPPNFIPRPDIGALLFGEFSQEFPGLTSQRGVELHWVGIGSWKTPSQIIPEQHLEAWQLSMDNQGRRGSGPPDLRAQHITRFIQDVPLIRFAEYLERQGSHRETMFSLLVGYREQFMKIISIMEKKQVMIDGVILNALRHINRILGWPSIFPARWINNPPSPWQGSAPSSGPTSPPQGPNAPSRSRPGAQSNRSYSAEEFALFNNLLLKTRNIETAVRLIEYERKLAPNESEIELIRRAIQRWEKDNR